MPICQESVLQSWTTSPPAETHKKLTSPFRPIRQDFHTHHRLHVAHLKHLGFQAHDRQGSARHHRPAKRVTGCPFRVSLSFAMQDTFCWTKQWYAVQYVEALEPKKPHALKFLGKELVLWRDSTGTWQCFEDRCAHRQAPLSGVNSTPNIFLRCKHSDLATLTLPTFPHIVDVSGSAGFLHVVIHRHMYCFPSAVCTSDRLRYALLC